MGKIYSAPGNQARPKITRTSKSEYIIVWEDDRKIYPALMMQKLSENLEPQWEKSGRYIHVSRYYQNVPSQLIGNGTGGVIWQNDDGINLYPQFSIDQYGRLEWELLPPSDYIFLGMAPDGNGGVFGLRTSADPSGRFEGNVSIRIVHFDNDGLENWHKNLMVFDTKGDITIHQTYISRVNKGEAVITWIQPDGGIDAQRMDLTGRFLWQGGVHVCEAKTDQFLLPEWVRIRGAKSNQFLLPEWIRIRKAKGNKVVWLDVYPDGKSGCIVTWAERKSGSGIDGTTHVYAQRLNRLGKKSWGRKGIHVFETKGPFMIRNDYLTGQGDMNGGVVIAWIRDFGEICAQHIDRKGKLLWTQQGILVEKNKSDPRKLEIVADGTGGAIVHWIDEKQDYHVQRVDANGVPVWKKGGVVLNGGKTGADGVDFTTDGKGGAVVACVLSLPGEDTDIWLFKITPDGELQ